jgi:hypothetical protein
MYRNIFDMFQRVAAQLIVRAVMFPTPAKKHMQQWLGNY